MTDSLILIIEDDEDIGTVLTEVLSDSGYRVARARNGREGLAAAQRERPALILLDLMMPIMDGWQFREEQMKRPDLASVPVVLMTADGRTAARAKELDATGFVAKPISEDSLLGEVARILASAQ
jgi:CheY-like chemotaxis protein